MPRELSPAEERAFARYEALGTPEELQKLAGDNEKLKKENAERRETNKALTEERDGLKAKVPEGAVILTGEEAKAYESLKAKGIALIDVPKVAEERDTLKATVAKRDRRDSLTKAVATEGWNEKSAGIVARLLGEAPVELKDEDVDVQENGKTVKKKMPVGYVTVDNKSVRLSEWAKGEDGLSELLSAKPEGAGGNGRPAPEQQGSGSGDGKAPTAGGIDEMLEANKKAATAPNPLRPAKAA